MNCWLLSLLLLQAQAGATCALLMACSLSGNLWAMAPAMAARIADTTHQVSLYV